MNAVTPLNVAGAQLPQAYEAAKGALANCAQIDECQDWADKAAALASYARQAEDETLLKYAQRIRGRAVSRCGELLKQFDGRGGDQSEKGANPLSAPTRREVASQAGLSVDQQKTAVRVANVPRDEFERLIESDNPPTVSQLASMGLKRRPVPPPPPAGFTEATTALGVVAEFAEFCRTHDAVFVAGGVHSSEVSDARADVGVIDAWLDRFIVNMKD